MSQHPEGDTSAPVSSHHVGHAPTGVAASEANPVSAPAIRPARSRMAHRWWIAGALTLVLAVPVGIGVAAAAGGSPSTAGGTGSAPQPTGTASCPATCGTGGAGGMAQHLRRMPHDLADMAEHGKNMMGGGAMMGRPTAAPSLP